MQHVKRVRSIIPQLASSLSSFQDSPESFRILQTVPSATNRDAPKTLFILDSSFNPPTNAHFTLASSALRIASKKFPPPYRLLLLFSTSNADKAPSPATFEHRLAMMFILASSLSKTCQEAQDINIDVGIAKDPYYTDKSTAISRATANGSVPEYANETQHIHLLGYDTLVRFLDPKYYTKFDPPLSALAWFFDSGHGLICTQRVSSSSSNQAGDTANSTKAQEDYITELRKGTLKNLGFKEVWADKILMVTADSDAEGVSSTSVRKAAKAHDWEVVLNMCGEDTTEWIRTEKIYEQDASGSKLVN